VAALVSSCTTVKKAQTQEKKGHVTAPRQPLRLALLAPVLIPPLHRRPCRPLPRNLQHQIAQVVVFLIRAHVDVEKHVGDESLDRQTRPSALRILAIRQVVEHTLNRQG